MFPFLVDMAKLYELFVAEWLTFNLPSHLSVRIQSPVYIGKIRRRIDVEICDTTTQNTLYILDTKYKLPDDKPSSSDIDQVNTYATAKKCSNAVLVYPNNLPNKFNARVGESNTWVRSLTFSIDGDLEQAGQEFLNNLCQSK